MEAVFIVSTLNPPSEGQEPRKRGHKYQFCVSYRNKLCMFFSFLEIPAVAVIKEHSVQPEQLPG